MISFKEFLNEAKFSGKTVGQWANQISKIMGAKKIGQGKKYNGNRSRYYKLKDGRELRVSDHLNVRKIGGGVADINFVLDEETGVVTISLNEVYVLKIEKEIMYIEIQDSRLNKNPTLHTLHNDYIGLDLCENEELIKEYVIGIAKAIKQKKDLIAFTKEFVKKHDIIDES